MGSVCSGTVGAIPPQVSPLHSWRRQGGIFSLPSFASICQKLGLALLPGSMCGYALTVKELVHGPEVQQKYMGVKVQANTRGTHNGEGWTMSLQSRWDSWVLQIISLLGVRETMECTVPTRGQSQVLLDGECVFRESGGPTLIPTRLEVPVICKWSVAFKTINKKK